MCFPVLVLILLGTIESCNMMFVTQSLKVTAFEGARVGVVPGATSTNVIFQCEALLADREINGATISMLPTDPSTLNSGDFFEVVISANYGDNSLVGGSLLGSTRLERSVSLQVQ